VHAIAILLYDVGAGTVVSNNTVNNNDLGIFAYTTQASPLTITNNHFTNIHYEGMELADGNMNINNNIFSAGNYGVFVFESSVSGYQVNMQNNQFLNASIAGLHVNPVGGGSPFVPSITVQNGSFVGNGIGVRNESNVVVDARFNWWGDASGPSLGAIDPVTSVVANGSGDSISPPAGGLMVRFADWLTSDPFALPPSPINPVSPTNNFNIVETNATNQANQTNTYFPPISIYNPLVKSEAVPVKEMKITSSENNKVGSLITDDNGIFIVYSLPGDEKSEVEVVDNAISNCAGDAECLRQLAEKSINWEDHFFIYSEPVFKDVFTLDNSASQGYSNKKR